ncbi:hypothetical protein ACFL2Q_11530 [Thermodesulfobacteriota bacterium]
MPTTATAQRQSYRVGIDRTGRQLRAILLSGDDGLFPIPQSSEGLQASHGHTRIIGTKRYWDRARVVLGPDVGLPGELTELGSVFDLKPTLGGRARSAGRDCMVRQDLHGDKSGRNTTH